MAYLVLIYKCYKIQIECKIYLLDINGESIDLLHLFTMQVANYIFK
jgi:hypothetical protein